MSGWKIKFQNKDISISPEFGVTLMISKRNNDANSISVVGLDTQKTCYKWIDSTMAFEDVLELDVTEISQQTAPISIKEFSLNTEETVTEETVTEKSDEIWMEELTEYRELHKLLKNEGLL